ncbi:hypothetical protein BDB00DRAFT_820826 [Zychaea mexicana]|uniref:uncharacterized protein n=1 Tax=Zychaea mexicana TaxID=64656 RepID=UPI0022FE9CA3|nr:uncharacterized protein BDB00DRAFT_820826 [Zychaea mexicana]KAI9494090.1 hypothetical protein BDB00DRAFT_820826 [Zychaea mexicana]
MARSLVSSKKGVLYWAVPLTVLAAGTAYGLRQFRYRASQHPIQFVSSGESKEDAEKLEHVRKDWRERNGGIGLKDVSRSGGGV